MALFWSKKSKAEKNYSTPVAPVKSSAKRTSGVPIKDSKKDSKTNRAVVPAQSSSPALPSGIFSSAADAILRPRITEKSGILSQLGTYTFEVSRNANRATVAKAVTALYKVTPVKIAMINLPAKNVFVRGKRGRVPGIRKALVTVKKGEKINFV